MPGPCTVAARRVRRGAAASTRTVAPQYQSVTLVRVVLPRGKLVVGRCEGIVRLRGVRIDGRVIGRDVLVLGRSDERRRRRVVELLERRRAVGRGRLGRRCRGGGRRGRLLVGALLGRR